MPETSESLPALISVGDAAKRLAISLRSLRKLIGIGSMPVVRVTERRIAIDEADLAAFVAARRTESHADAMV